MADETNREREQKALALAREQGKREAELAQNTKANRDRLDAVNGSIDRVDGCLKEIVDRLSSIESRERARDAVSKATKEAIDAHGKAQITTRTFVVGVVALVIALGSLLVGLNPPGP